ncbi:MAG: DUF2306 domain-containing protein [Pseudomonadota bacterium]
MVDLAPLFAAGPVISGHALAAVAAILLGAVQFALPKGTPLHRGVGYSWVGILGFVAASSFFIHEYRLVGPFSPIHLLSVLTLWSLSRVILTARQGRIRRHRRLTRELYGLALLLTGLFTLLPGRIMHTVIFGA